MQRAQWGQTRDQDCDVLVCHIQQDAALRDSGKGNKPSG